MIKTFFSKIFVYCKTHKLISIIILLVLLGGGYYLYKFFAPVAPTQYITEKVAYKDIVLQVTGSGQISADTQLDVRPEVSGKILGIYVKSGDKVKAGQKMIQLDDTDARKTLRDAQSNYESALLALEKLKKPADEYSLIQTENSLAQAKDSLEKLKLSQESDKKKALDTQTKALDTIEQAFEDIYSNVNNAFLELPNTIVDLADILYDSKIADSEAMVGDGKSNIGTLADTVDSDYRDRIQSFVYSAEQSYNKSRDLYEKNLVSYKQANRFSDRITLENLLNETTINLKMMADTVKTETTLLEAWADYRNQVNQPIYNSVLQYQTSLNSYTTKLNSYISSLTTVSNALRDARQSLTNAEKDLSDMQKNQPRDIANAEQQIQEKESSLKDLKDGTDVLDIRSQELTVRQRLNTLEDARNTLSDYTIVAPFDSVVASVTAKISDNVGSGSTLVTVITQKKLAQISMNEVDAAKVKIEQKAKITFDAIENFSLDALVSEIDPVGTVSQGVVNYTIKFMIDSDDERIKPGMSVDAKIEVDRRDHVLAVPSAAIKTNTEGKSSVEILQKSAGKNIPEKKDVEVGLTDEILVEIISGVNEGDEVVTKTILAADQVATTKPATSIFGGGAARR